MLCPSCGNDLKQGATFCARCGQPVQMQAQQPHHQPYHQPHHQPAAQAAATSGSKFVIIACSLAAVAVICAVVVAIVFFTNGSPFGSGGAAGGDTVSEGSDDRGVDGGGATGPAPIATSAQAAEVAMASLGNDLTSRLESTPFGAFPMLINALNDGVVSFSLDYTDMWSSGSFDVEIHINDARREAMSLWNIYIEGFEFDLEWHMNRYSTAFRTGLLGDEFFGFEYATFRQDIMPLAQALGIPAWEVDEMAALIEWAGELMAMPDIGLEAFLPYEQLVDQFVQGGALPPESATITSGGQSVNVTRAAFRFTEDDIVRFLRDFLRIMSQDSNMDVFGMIDPWMWDQIMRDFEMVADEMARYVTGEMEVAIYIGPGNRLVRFEINGEMNEVGGDGTAGFVFYADFGTSALAPWTFSLEGFFEEESWADPTQMNSDGFVFEILWTHNETGGRFVNTIEITFTEHSSWWDSWAEEMVENTWSSTARMISDWNRNTGDFVLRFEEDDWGDSFEFGGYFSLDGRGGFTLGFSHDTGWETFDIEISSSIGTNFTTVRDFTNIMDIPVGALLDLMFAF